MTKKKPDAILTDIAAALRKHGYEGASLHILSEMTGLKRSSLYHHFPGGKDEMVMHVLDTGYAWVQENIVQKVEQLDSPQEKLQLLTGKLQELYLKGSVPCLLNALSFVGDEEDKFLPARTRGLQAFLNLFCHIAQRAGKKPAEAKLAAEQALVELQGSLVISYGLKDTGPFKRTLERFREILL